MPLPRCEHGKSPLSTFGCRECDRRDAELRTAVKPLEAEFLEGLDLCWLLMRAYRQGQRAALDASKLKAVWQGWHHDFDVVGPPVLADGLLVVHVTDESMHALLGAPEPCGEG
ncbi:MAG: hypothetical protein AB1578_22770 [Thermodesulfobacteriota bacterium]